MSGSGSNKLRDNSTSLESAMGNSNMHPDDTSIVYSNPLLFSANIPSNSKIENFRTFSHNSVSSYVGRNNPPSVDETFFKRAISNISGVSEGNTSTSTSTGARTISVLVIPIQKERSYNFLDLSGLVVRCFTVVGICLTFGLVYPPLAVLGLLSISAATFFKQLLLARIWSEAAANNQKEIMSMVSRDCSGLTTLIWRSGVFIFPLPFFFFSLFLLDISGSDTNEPKITWNFAWPAFILTCIPFVVFVAYQLQKCLVAYRRSNVESLPRISQSDRST